jgi:O-antigen/teichoic acid export membrane protein
VDLTFNLARGMARTALTNAILQGMTMLGKAALLVALARYLSVADLGLFGLLFATVNFAMYAVGFDFATFATRELIAAPRERVPFLLRSQLSLHFAAYAVVMPMLLLVFATGTLSWSLAPWFYVLLVLEHLGQELQRVLITLQRSSQATLLMFIRQGMWGGAVAVTLALVPASRDLHVVLSVWGSCELLGLLIGLMLLRPLGWGPAFASPTDWAWVRRGLRIAAPFFVSTLSTAAMSTCDRYALQHFAGNAAVGVFTFFMFFRNAIQGLIDVGVVFVLFPRIVHAWHSGDRVRYRQLLLGLFGGALGASALMAIAAMVVVKPALALVGHDAYAKELPAFWMIMGMTVVAALCEVPQAGLYARHRDRTIVISAVLGVVVAVIANLVLVPRFGVMGAAMATTCGFMTVGLSKALGLKLAGS